MKCSAPTVNASSRCRNRRQRSGSGYCSSRNFSMRSVLFRMYSNHAVGYPISASCLLRSR
ncbi:Uncharacterised protein [Mycobacteroides abscessus subsp. abscessus]|nr:Uncharacterised protein [Mycobacteroides abscessus subsp. abscessus]